MTVVGFGTYKQLILSEKIEYLLMTIVINARKNRKLVTSLFREAIYFILTSSC